MLCLLTSDFVFGGNFGDLAHPPFWLQIHHPVAHRDEVFSSAFLLALDGQKYSLMKIFFLPSIALRAIDLR
jgi:hypothetical protein